MSGFEKLFITNELLGAIASSLSLGEAFKKIFVILENHLKIKGAAVVTYNAAKKAFEVQRGFQHKLVRSKVLKFLNNNEFFINEEKIFSIDKHVIKDADDGESRFLYFPLFIHSKLSAMLILHINADDISAHSIDANLVEAISAPISIIYERELLFNETRTQKLGFEFLHKLSNSINKTLDVESILRISVKTICRQFEDLVAVLAISRAGFKYIATGSTRIFDIENNFKKILEQLKANLDENIDDFNIIRGVLPDSEQDCKNPLTIDTESSLWLSLNYNNNIYGYLGLFSSKYGLENINAESIKFLTLASNHIISAVENARLYSEVERLASIDGMTGVFNYRYFYNHLKTEIQRARRYSLDLSVIMFDIDHFKSFNDMYGHQAGDDVLRAVGKILFDEARKIDIVARYGGEEFILVAPETDVAGALELAERIRYKIEVNDFAVKSKSNSLLLKVSISVGVSTFSQDASADSDIIIKSADDALYHAKHSGRNRVCYSDKGELKQFRRSQ